MHNSLPLLKNFNQHVAPTRMRAPVHLFVCRNEIDFPSHVISRQILTLTRARLE